MFTKPFISSLFAVLTFICLTTSSYAIEAGDAAPTKSVTVQFAPASFNEEEFIGKTVEARQLAHLQNVRAANEVHEKCAEAAKKNPTYKTDEERDLAIKAYCPSPANNNFRLKSIDVTCEMGVDCGKKFEVSKRDMAAFKAFFLRKTVAVYEAKKRSLHVSQVEAFAYKQAKAPNRLGIYWFVRCLENFEEPRDEEE